MIWDLGKFGTSTALVEEGKQYSYKVLEENAKELVKAIDGRRLIFILSSNTYESVLAYVGCLNNGIVPLMLDSEITKELLDNLYREYKPDYIYLPMEKLDEQTFEGGRQVYKGLQYVLIKTEYDGAYKLHEELALLISTSGSTGSPKLIRQTYNNLRANTKSIIQYLEITDQETAITTLPMNYVYGLSVINTHLMAGAKLVLTKASPYSKQFWQQFDENSATSFAGVPFMYEMLDKLRFTKKHKHTTLGTMTQAGGKLSPELHEKFAGFASENGLKFVVMYGASEATARMGYLPADKSLEKKGSMGVAIPGGRFELIDENNEIISEANRVGELVYYGENVTLGYAQNGSDLALPDANNGKLITGDMAYRDEDGFYYITGRKKRFIKMLGKRINLDEIERMIKTNFQVVGLACTGKDDMLMVCYEESVDEEAVIEYVNLMTQINKYMIKLVQVPAIPQNASGKVLYSKLLEMVEVNG